jgi:hypothetical protein
MSQATNNRKETIRNLVKFITQYKKSESAQRSLQRHPSYVVCKMKDNKGEYTVQKDAKGNQLAVALIAAI